MFGGESNKSQKTLAIVQSNYIPWKGYFDLINSADVFVLYDDVAFSKGSYRNRNQIKTPRGVQWLTIPVKVSLGTPIKDVPIVGDDWKAKHWRILLESYESAPFFKEVSQLLQPFYFGRSYTHLSELNREMILSLNEYLGIKTVIRASMEFELRGDRVERLINLCHDVGANSYLSGPAAQAYIGEVEQEQFAVANVALSYFNYDGYPEYEQLHGPFEHGVSVLDLMFMTGKEAPRYMLSFKDG